MDDLTNPSVARASANPAGHIDEALERARRTVETPLPGAPGWRSSSRSSAVEPIRLGCDRIGAPPHSANTDSSRKRKAKKTAAKKKISHQGKGGKNGKARARRR